jgi:hypothetical protein
MKRERDDNERQKDDEQQHADQVGELSLSFCALIAHGWCGLTSELSDAGSRVRPHCQLTWPARVRCHVGLQGGPNRGHLLNVR